MGATGPTRGRYRVLNGLSYKGKRADAGQVVSDLPAKSVRWLLEQGHIEPAGEGKED